MTPRKSEQLVGLLDISQPELSEMASSERRNSKDDLECLAAAIRGTAETLWKLQTALEKAGVEFIGGVSSFQPTTIKARACA